MPSIKWVRPAGRPKIFSIYKKITSLGRATANDVAIDDRTLAEHHAQIVFDGKAFNLNEVDLEADIQVNQKKKRRVRLEHGDRIDLGKVELHFSLFDDADKDTEDDETATGQSDERSVVVGLRQLHELSQRLMQAREMTDKLSLLMDAVIAATHAAKGFLVLLEAGDRKSVV